MQKYLKALVALVFAGLTVLASALTDDRFDTGEAVQVAIAVCTAAGVWLVPTVPQWPWMKTAIAMLLASLSLAVSLITDGVTAAEAVNLVLAALAVLAVGMVPQPLSVPTRAGTGQRDTA